MKATVFGSGACIPGEKMPEQILAGWLRAAALFHSYYHQLVGQASQQVHQADLLGDTPLAHASRQPLLTLVMAMQAELATLLQDMDQLALLTQSPTPRGYQKLAAHT
ncbi:hypothetical protein [Spirosoma endophyticum]|nr:hypothetical protein [Spirosoma endophyticum]